MIEIDEATDNSLVLKTETVPDMVICHTGEKAMIYIPTSSEMWQGIDVEQVRHGYWKKGKLGTCYCSICDSTDHYFEEGEEFAYCPDCGAKMDGTG